jgi:hypothetical protein
MGFMRNFNVYFVCLTFAIIIFSFSAFGQSKYEVLSGETLKRIVPTSFYFAGQSAETQIRNAAAAKIGENRFVIAGLVDTSGYSTEISGKYEGFFITDSPIKFGDKVLNTGAYGFGFAPNNKVNVFDLSSKQILFVKTVNDQEIKRPRPLMMTVDAKGIRLYKGKFYVVISAK